MYSGSLCYVQYVLIVLVNRMGKVPFIGYMYIKVTVLCIRVYCIICTCKVIFMYAHLYVVPPSISLISLQPFSPPQRHHWHDAAL